MGARVPIFRDHDRRYEADACAAVVDADARGAIRLEALARGQYPGRRLPQRELAGVKSVGFWDAEIEQEWGLATHRNEGIELTFLETGRLDFVADRKAYQLQPDDLTITRPWQPHQIGDPHVGASRLHWLILDVGVRRPHQKWNWPNWMTLTSGDAARLTNFLRHCGQHVWPTGAALRRCWQHIGETVRRDREGDHLSRLAVHLNELFVLLLELFDAGDVRLDESLSSSRHTVQLFLDELEREPERLGHAWSVKEMAEHCGLGVTRFTALCRQVTHQTPTHYLTRLRIDRAVRLLRERASMSVTQIAHACGFSSSQYFATVLKQHTGRRPSDFRASESENGDSGAAAGDAMAVK